VQVGRIKFNDFARRARRMVKSKGTAFIRRPFRAWAFARIGVLPSKGWPPFDLKTFEPPARVVRTDRKPCNSILIFDNESQMRLQQGIRRGIYLPD
jgi:hypothetical protein